MDRNLALEMVRVTEAAALAAARWMGKGDGKSADAAAVEAMRDVLDSIPFDGQIVIGEGERDEAPMLYIGEKVGKGNEPQVDIAVDPLECTNSVAYGRGNAMAVVAMAPKGDLLNAPDCYMEKIAVGAEAADVIDLAAPIEENLARVAKAKDYAISDLTVVILDRDRHAEIISRVRKVGARIHLITDGDVAAAIAAASPQTGIDLLLGTGGAPEGVLAAAALRCLGGEIQGRLVFRNKDEVRRAEAMGITDLNKIYRAEDLAKGDNVMFACTGVTDGDLLRGVQYHTDGAKTHSLVMRLATGTRRTITTEHFFRGHPKY